MELSREMTQELLQVAPAAYDANVEDLLLSALSRALWRWTGQDEAVITLEGHGREGDAADLDLGRTVGWFTTMYPVRLRCGDDSLESTIRTTKARLRAVPNKGVGYGVLRYLSRDHQLLTPWDDPASRITFNYLGQFDQTFKPGGQFVPAEEGRGAERAEQGVLPALLELIGGVYAGQLSMKWVFSSAVYRRSTIEQVLRTYQQELTEIIRCSTTDRRSAATAVDRLEA
jgi:non-ribosomal peptide synthase protein (TIGR01720 family)